MLQFLGGSIQAGSPIKMTHLPLGKCWQPCSSVCGSVETVTQPYNILTLICWLCAAMLGFLGSRGGGCHPRPSGGDSAGYFHTSSWRQLADVGRHGVEQSVCFCWLHEQKLHREITHHSVTVVTRVPWTEKSQTMLSPYQHNTFHEQRNHRPCYDHINKICFTNREIIDHAITVSTQYISRTEISQTLLSPYQHNMFHEQRNHRPCYHCINTTRFMDKDITNHAVTAATQWAALCEHTGTPTPPPAWLLC